ncbi:MAG: phenylalanine--tRNA ligase subunit alpha [Alphaproteobacteria bacterium 16-39-46]|nr:MAG: phenylalanine--tRNA ligase subunit alpha [Alphaproteobacteria bacterium 16-39-46]OZA42149.1 MAG: phenylalanine--tRNA ligase subunit alpha [Alphaproteobacteria bacterium 17-39-52]HQS84627.1 phenylalanine--tRNA ligase subunit alpha [Alphaproteobacteria bacterium]HQS94439.1 phenylalanine--tRNA ligase subunit alpha [Alphaproteobacteria bacterium]
MSSSSSVLDPRALESLLQNIKETQTLSGLDDIRISILGKKGLLTEHMKTLGALSPDEKRTQGAFLNSFKSKIEEALESQKKLLETLALEDSLKEVWEDITLPIRPSISGKVHPLTQAKEEVLSFFTKKGFSLEEGPEIETSDYNFSDLNIPKHHPARQMHDTFYLKARNPQNPEEALLLRTHTSNVQIRQFKTKKPPFRFVSIGPVYRSDYDNTHTPMFHQIELVALEKGLNMGHLKGLLTEFLKFFFDLPELEIRLRPSFFPFTEPSAEVDIGYSHKDGKIVLGKAENWLEILGCGMIHPNVISNCGLDPSEIGGFAFGMGLERIAMLKYGIPDLRSFFEGDLRWLNHYGFSWGTSPSLFGSVVP